MDVGKDTARGDGDISEQLVQLLVILDGEGEVTRHNASMFVSQAALPASSRISAQRYSRTAAR